MRDERSPELASAVPMGAHAAESFLGIIRRRSAFGDSRSLSMQSEAMTDDAADSHVATYICIAAWRPRRTCLEPQERTR